jgi:hypothetical protein
MQINLHVIQLSAHVRLRSESFFGTSTASGGWGKLSRDMEEMNGKSNLRSLLARIILWLNMMESLKATLGGEGESLKNR